MELVFPATASPSSLAVAAVAGAAGLFAGNALKWSKSADASCQEVVLKTPQVEVKGAVNAAHALANQANRGDLLGANSQQGEIDKWTALQQVSLSELNETLAAKTFLVGNTLTLADLFVFGAAHSSVSALSDIERFDLANATRWFDHVQSHAASAPAELLTLVKINANAATLQAEKDRTNKGKEAPKPAAPKTAAPKDVAPKAATPTPTPVSTPVTAAEPKAKSAPREPKAKAAPKEKAPSAQPKGGKGKAAAPESNQGDYSRVLIKVGKIIDVQKHPESEKLYVEKIDLGEKEPRTIVSGLAQFVTLDEMRGKYVAVVANLKPRDFVKVNSQGMVLCASNADHSQVELLILPDGLTVGERVVCEGEEGEAEELLNPKKKLFEKVQPELRVNDELVATYKGKPLLTSKGPIRAKSLKGGSIS